MSKRLSDSKKWKKRYLKGLTPHGKLAYAVLSDICDHAGIWLVDLDELNSLTGLSYANLTNLVVDLAGEQDDIMGEVVVFQDRDGFKLWLRSFYLEQYEDAADDFKAKKSAFKLLEKHGLVQYLDHEPTYAPCNDVASLSKASPSSNSIPNPIHTVPNPLVESLDCPSKSISIGISKSTSKDFEGGAGETFTATKIITEFQAGPTDPKKIFELAELTTAWGETLKHFKINKDPRLDEPLIFSLSKRHGFEKTKLAIKGSRYEQKTESFDPAKHLSIQRLMTKPAIFDKLVNLGAQDQTASKFRKSDYSYLEEQK